MEVVPAKKADGLEKKNAQRYRLLRDYFLDGGYIIHQRTPRDQEPFVLDADFYGPTFAEAVDTLRTLEGSPEPWQACRSQKVATPSRN